MASLFLIEFGYDPDFLCGHNHAGLRHGFLQEWESEPGGGEAKEEASKGAQQRRTFAIGNEVETGDLAEQLAKAIQCNWRKPNKDPQNPMQRPQFFPRKRIQQAKDQHASIDSHIAFTKCDLI